tara:strand:+ start:184 stop:552 length:369 start_codon:yes stop_codon:yes gene_type:complete
MSKILQTQLPTATGPLSPEIFNRLVRILELNLGPIDTDNTRQVSIEQRGSLSFNPGSIIWNTTLGVLQVWTGNEWVDIGKKIFDTGYQANAYLGNVTVTTGGDVSINVTENLTGYGIEKWYS